VAKTANRNSDRMQREDDKINAQVREDLYTTYDDEA